MEAWIFMTPGLNKLPSWALEQFEAEFQISRGSIQGFCKLCRSHGNGSPNNEKSMKTQRIPVGIQDILISLSWISKIPRSDMLGNSSIELQDWWKMNWNKLMWQSDWKRCWLLQIIDVWSCMQWNKGMLWVHGKPLFIQHDGAKPYNGRRNKESRMHKVNEMAGIFKLSLN